MLNQSKCCSCSNGKNVENYYFKSTYLFKADSCSGIPFSTHSIKSCSWGLVGVGVTGSGTGSGPDVSGEGVHLSLGRTLSGSRITPCRFPSYFLKEYKIFKMQIASLLIAGTYLLIQKWVFIFDHILTVVKHNVSTILNTNRYHP